jgi:hypothetical protein
MRNKLINFLCDRFDWPANVFTEDESDIFDLDGDYTLDYYVIHDDTFGYFGKFVDYNSLQNLIKANGIDDISVFRTKDFKQLTIELTINIIEDN